MDPFQLQSMPLSSLLYIINHVFLPPKLPQSSKESSDALQDEFLLEALIQSLESCGNYLNASDREAVQDVYLAMTELRRVRNEDGTVHEESLLVSMKHMLRQGRSPQLAWYLLTLYS